MAQTVLGAVGAGIGFIYGGPTGAQYGWMIGSAVGGAIDPQVIQGPRIGEIAQQTSQEGIPRPIVFALSPPITGNIIATGDPVIVKRKQSGKGGPKVETEAVFRTYAIGVCEGPITGFVRVWRNGILVYDVSENSLLTEEENEFFLQKARFFLGSYEQQPSPDLESLFGIGTTPAHQGTAYMVMADEDLTDMRGAIPQFVFQVGAHGEYIREVFYENTIWTVPGGVTSVDVVVVAGGGAGGTFGGAGGGGGGGHVVAVGHPVTPGADVNVVVGIFSAGQGFNSSFGGLVAQGGGRGGNSPEAPAGAGGCGGGGGGREGGSPGASGTQGQSGGAGVEPSGSLSRAGGGGGGATLSGEDAWATVGPVYGPAGKGGDGVYLGDITGDDIGAVGWFCGGGGGGSSHGGFVGPAPGGVGGGGNAGADSSVDPNDHTGGGGGGPQPAGGFTANQNGRSGVVVIRYLDPTSEAATLAGVVSTLVERAGLDASHLDVSELVQEVRGFAVTNTYPCTGALQALSQVFLFDPSNYDAVIHFVRRGADASLTITEDEMLVDEIEQSKRGDAISVPRVLHLNYHDVAGGLATDKQTSERSGDRRATGEVSLQTAVLMNADEAAQVLSINHKVMIEDQKGELKFSIPDNMIALSVADIVIVQWQGSSERCRIVQCDMQDGYQEITAVRDRQSAYTSDVQGIPAAPQTPPPSGIVGPTLIQPLDIHILRDADDSLSYYVAVSGLLPAWQGALIELSLDSGENYIDSATWNVASVMGETVTVLRDHPQAYPDEINAVQVRIDTPLGELLETDLRGLLNRQNVAIIGDELIQFANADEVSQGVWELSYFLRGRKGTATEEHPVGKRFVLLQRGNLAFVPANLTDLGRTLTFRATSFGNTSGTVVSMVYGGASQTERAPAYLQAHLDGDNVVISWQGVGRLGAGAQVAHGVNFAGYRVTVSDGSLTDTFDTTDESLTEDVSGFSSPMTISVQQRNSLTGLGPAIEVIL